jgi:hypothetical protein
LSSIAGEYEAFRKVWFGRPASSQNDRGATTRRIGVGSARDPPSTCETMTPVTAESLHNLAELAATQWIEVFAARVPPRLVNPSAWPRYADRFECIFGFAPSPLVKMTV